MRSRLALSAYLFLAVAALSVVAFAETIVDPKWLQQKITLEQAEAENTPKVDDESRAKSPELAKPFGFQNHEWEARKALMQSGYEIWMFSSPAESWQALAGRAGVALVRRGRVIATVVTLRN